MGEKGLFQKHYPITLITNLAHLMVASATTFPVSPGMHPFPHTYLGRQHQLPRTPHSAVATVSSGGGNSSSKVSQQSTATRGGGSSGSGGRWRAPGEGWMRGEVFLVNPTEVVSAEGVKRYPKGTFGIR